MVAARLDRLRPRHRQGRVKAGEAAEGSLDAADARGCSWRGSRRFQAIVITSVRGEGTRGVVSKSEACFGRARRGRGCLS